MPARRRIARPERPGGGDGRCPAGFSGPGGEKFPEFAQNWLYSRSPGASLRAPAHRMVPFAGPTSQPSFHSHESSVLTLLCQASSRGLPNREAQGHGVCHLQEQPEIQGPPGRHSRHAAVQERPLTPAPPGISFSKRLRHTGPLFSLACIHPCSRHRNFPPDDHRASAVFLQKGMSHGACAHIA